MSIIQKSLYKLVGKFPTCTATSTRNLFGILRVAFNAVDQQRLLEVGPDRLCAEWILKNGGTVKFSGKGTVSDYNTLPAQNQFIRINEINATESSIMALGFEHFQHCHNIERITLHKCQHMENEALEMLSVYIKDTLKYLQVSECYNVTDSGLMSLDKLTNLKELLMFGLPYVKNMEGVKAHLEKSLPDCKISLER